MAQRKDDKAMEKRAVRHRLMAKSATGKSKIGRAECRARKMSHAAADANTPHA